MTMMIRAKEPVLQINSTFTVLRMAKAQQTVTSNKLQQNNEKSQKHCMDGDHFLSCFNFKILLVEMKINRMNK